MTTITLRERIDELIAQHGTLRATARVLMTDCGYLHRLRSGEKTEPGDPLLRRMGLREVTRYERVSSTPAQGDGEQEVPVTDKKLDEFHSHEVLHTLHVVRNLIERELSEHPFTAAHPVVKAAISRAQRALGIAYHLTGAIEFEADATAGAQVDGGTGDLSAVDRITDANRHGEAWPDGAAAQPSGSEAQRTIGAAAGPQQTEPFWCHEQSHDRPRCEAQCAECAEDGVPVSQESNVVETLRLARLALRNATAPVGNHSARMLIGEALLALDRAIAGVSEVCQRCGAIEANGESHGVPCIASGVKTVDGGQR